MNFCGLNNRDNFINIAIVPVMIDPAHNRMMMQLSQPNGFQLPPFVDKQFFTGKNPLFLHQRP
jgi:hypothetical protein